MTDRELLELAAKAAGMHNPCYMEINQNKGINRGPTESLWNPLADDGDALRLAVKLGLVIDVQLFTEVTTAWTSDVSGAADCEERHKYDPCAATRRAIVRAAAEIGRSMP